MRLGLLSRQNFVGQYMFFTSLKRNDAGGNLIHRACYFSASMFSGGIYTV